MKDIFTDLWDSLPEAEHGVWACHLPRAEKANRLTEVLELLCSVLWRLEIAFALGNFPKENIVDYRENVRKDIDRLPWELWREQRKDLSVQLLENQLRINHHFRESPHDCVRVLIQSTVIADAALRLAGAREVLRSIHSQKNAPIFTKPRDMEDWLDGATANFKEPLTEIEKQVTLVVSFRDGYMHGGVPEKATKKRMWMFREKHLPYYKLAEIFEACLGVWVELREKFNEILVELRVSSGS